MEHKTITANGSQYPTQLEGTADHHPPTSSGGYRYGCSGCRDEGCPRCQSPPSHHLQNKHKLAMTSSDLQNIKVEPSTPLPQSPQHQNHSQSSQSLAESASIFQQKMLDKDKALEGRKWKYFPGKNKFYCDGRVITAPTIRFCILCFGLIVVTFGLFIIFDGPFLADRLTIAIPIIGSILFLTVLVNMVKTSFTDPGILPRASQQESEYMEKLYATNNQSRPPPRTIDIVVNGQTMKSKYCFTCKMFRPPRASHCGVCDNCVDRFDHHCPFLGNCIGKRNYRSFYTFVLSLSFLSVFVLSCSIAHLALISKEKGNFLEALKDSPTSAVVVVISFFGMWTVLGLTGFHTYLIAVEQTTNEDIKGLFGRQAVKNPFSKGNMCQNCCFILCGPVQPSLIDRRGFITEDFLASLPKKNEVNGVATSSVCNPTNFQSSIKTGPHCVEPQTRQPAPRLPSDHTLSHESSTAQFPNSTIIAMDQSMESGAGDYPQQITRSIGDVSSESMRNLYTPIEDETIDSTTTITSEDFPYSKMNSYPPLSPVNNRRSFLELMREDMISSEFDDPTTVINLNHTRHSVSQQRRREDRDHFIQDLELDDPLSASSSRISATSNSGGQKKKSPPSINNNSNKSNANSNSQRNLSQNGKVKSSSSSSIRAKKVVNKSSTMIDSPLDLDTIT